jgi:hypothetical protein
MNINDIIADYITQQRFIGGTAWTRLAVFTEPRPVEPGRAVGDSLQPVLAAATREG